MSLAAWGSNRELTKLVGIADYFLCMASDKIKI